MRSYEKTVGSLIINKNNRKQPKRVNWEVGSFVLGKSNNYHGKVEIGL
jgi:hypothetical protein